jgi:hypothetical protein
MEQNMVTISELIEPEDIPDPPCINCITLPICKLDFQSLTFRDTRMNIRALGLKCNLISDYLYIDKTELDHPQGKKTVRLLSRYRLDLLYDYFVHGVYKK